MLVHDGILLELDNDEQARHAIEIMEQAGIAVCGGLKIGVDVDQRLVGGARYRDKRPMAQKMWATVMGVLQEIGAMPGTEHAKLKIRDGKLVPSRPKRRWNASVGRRPRATNQREPRGEPAPDRVTFAKLMRAQMLRMHGVSTTWDVFSGLLQESFRSHGNSFILPIKQLAEMPGMSLRNLHRILQELERRGLITVTRRPPKPPLVTVHK